MAESTQGMISIKLIRSPICTPEKHKVIVRALGLQKDEPGCGAARYAGASAASSRRSRICWRWLTEKKIGHE